MTNNQVLATQPTVQRISDAYEPKGFVLAKFPYYAQLSETQDAIVIGA